MIFLHNSIVDPRYGGGQAHHIVPFELKNHELTKRAAKGGFNINGANNGIRLQTTQHLGSHPKYTNAVRTKLNSIIKNNPNISNVDASHAVQTYVDQLSKGLTRSSSKIR